MFSYSSTRTLTHAFYLKNKNKNQTNAPPENKPPSQTNKQTNSFFSYDLSLAIWTEGISNHYSELFLKFSSVSVHQINFQCSDGKGFLFLTPLTRQTRVIQQSHNKPVASTIATIYPFDSFLLKIVHYFSNTYDKHTRQQMCS